MKNIEKRLYVLAFVVLALIAGARNIPQAEADHQFRKINPSYKGESEYSRLIRTIEEGKRFTNRLPNQ